jgi:hypothetical protein
MRSLARMSIRRLLLAAVLLLGAMVAAGVAWLMWWTARVPHEAPPRADDRFAVAPQTSEIAVPVSAPLARLSRALEQAVPRTLWTIDKPGQTCLASKKVKVLFARVKTPTIRCTIVGTVTRGPLALSGAGRTITVAMPLHAVVSAQDIGGVVKRETATADAQVRALVTLDLAPDWSPRGTVDIRYDWSDAPHIDILGQRIEFTSKADAKLAGVIAKLERTLPRELAKLSVREHVAAAWASAFTSLQLNRANPPVWMRVTPQALSYGGYAIVGQQLTLRLGMTARTETFVGPRPPDPAPTPLPRATQVTGTPGAIRFTIPVIADYHELEPVLMRALTKRSARPFEVPGLGPVNARFGSVTMYGTTGGRIAAGVTFSAARPGGVPSHGTVWLTARPVNAANSRVVRFADLSVAGVTDSTGTSLLLRLANAPVLADTVAEALTQNFAKDYDKLLGKIGRALAEKPVGPFLLRARVDDVRTDPLKAAGQGLYLSVTGKGTAALTLQPGARF